LDVSKFRVGDWVLVVAGAVMLILGLALHWATIHANGITYPGTRNAFDYPVTGGLAWLFTVAPGVVTFLLATRLVPPGRAPWTRLMVGSTALATLLMLLRLILGGGADQRIGNQVVSLGRGLGMYVALLAAIGALVGALLNLRAEDDSLQEIYADIRARFRPEEPGGDSALPPPDPGTVPRDPGTPPRDPPTQPGR
jgi:hypothetical protein